MISYKELEYLIDHFGFEKSMTAINYKTNSSQTDIIEFTDRENRLVIYSSFEDGPLDSDYQIEVRRIVYTNKNNGDSIEKLLNEIMGYYDDNGTAIPYNIKKYGRITKMRRKLEECPALDKFVKDQK